ncbi:hypothetical protein D3C85_1334290 [compost metagenome]
MAIGRYWGYVQAVLVYKLFGGFAVEQTEISSSAFVSFRWLSCWNVSVRVDGCVNCTYSSLV